MIIEVLLTIVTGVLVLVASQLALRLVVDPVVAFKEKLGEVSHYFLSHQAAITNASESEELSTEAKKLSAELLAKREAVTRYGLFACILRLPNAAEVTRACGELNNISHLLRVQSESARTNNKSDRSAQIHGSMKTIESTLKVRVAFG